MLNAFKIKEFDLQPIFEEWTDGPIFNGNTKKDLPVEEWLDKIKEGCEKRGVPEQYWYKVAQHFMGPKAKVRLDELKQVIAKVHGAKYRWTWKKFRVAMLNMGWSIDMNQKETIRIQGRSSGMWFTRKKDTETSSVKDMPQDPPRASGSTAGKPRPTASRSNTLWLSNKAVVDEPSEEPEPLPKKPTTKTPTAARRRPSRSATVSGFWSAKKNSPDHTKDDMDIPERPGHEKTRSETTVMKVTKRKQSRSPSSSRTRSEVGEVGATTGADNQGEVITTKAEAPAWLLNAFTALEFITSEHPKAMSVVSAILITAGSIPAIPAIAAGAGGAALASSAAHAIGAIAVAAGQALGAGVVHGQKQNRSDSGSIVEEHH